MKSTKKSLIMSTISLILCFAMLLGSTYAWFTDEVTSGVNKIVAGNLDIEVSYKNGADWESIQNVGTLFSSNLWEPGHTEYVTLKIENKGTLALTYKMMVTPVNEAGGINMAGQPFKLSDYLMFGTTAASATELTYTRESARAAAGNTMQLNQAGLVKTATMNANADPQYVTLVVYMPETVGNEANYKTGTTAPTIDLGIKVVATQVENESDSFNNTYDAGATSVGAYNVGPVYNYFPQVMASAAKAESGNTTITASGKLNKDDTAVTQLAKVVVPAGAVDEGVSTLTLKVTPQAPTSNTSDSLSAEISDANREIANFDVKVEGVKSGNTAGIDVELFVGTGLSNVKVYHNGVQMTATYDAATGYVTFTTTSFSDYTVAYDVAVAAIGTQTYGTLALAVAAAQNNDTIVMLKSHSGAGVAMWNSTAKDFTIDFNGNTFTCVGPAVGSTGTESQAFHLEGQKNVTLKNGTITCESNKGIKMLVQNYCNLTLENIILDGRNLDDSNIPFYTLSNNGGITTTIKSGTKIYAHADVNDHKGKAFDSDKGATVVVEGGEFYGLLEKSDNSTISISGGTFTDLANAIKYAADNATIKLAKDAAGPGLMKTTQGNLTIDFGGHTYTMNNPAVGSTGTATQAMHWERATVILKNGTFKVASGADNVKMAMQNYTNFTAENMVFDFTNINVEKYSGLTGNNAIYNDKERIMFANNVNSAGTGVLMLKNSTVKMPANSQYGVCTEGALTLDNTKIEGSVCFDEPNGSVTFNNGSSATKGVVPYFDTIKVTENNGTYTAAQKTN